MCDECTNIFLTDSIICVSFESYCLCDPVKCCLSLIRLKYMKGKKLMLNKKGHVG